jgi:hypothetical protein
MANWKKMAEAFGRAMSTRKGTGPAAEAVGKSETLKFKTGGKSPEERAYLHGHETEGPDEYYVAKERDGDYEKNIDDIEDENSSMRLQDDFNKALDEAAENRGYKKWRDESKDMPANDGFGGSLHDVNREDAVQRSREEIIKALQQNTDRDVTDVLRDFGYIFEE